MKEVRNGAVYTMPDAPVTTLEERIQRLEDIEKIKELTYHYARCTDKIDGPGVASIYTEDGMLCNPRLGNPHGREALAELYTKMLTGAGMRNSNHYFTNHQIWFKTKDCALMHFYLTSWASHGDDVPPTASYGRYEWLVVREADGEWRVKEFKLIFSGTQTGLEQTVNDAYMAREWPPVPSNP